MRATASYQEIKSRAGLKMAYILGTFYYGMFAVLASGEAYFVALMFIRDPLWGSLFWSGVTVTSFWFFVYRFVWRGGFLLPPVGKTVEQAVGELTR